MAWEVDFHDEFVAEYDDLPEAVQDELLAVIEVLEKVGPQLGRPRVDTLNGSAHANMKELRFNADGGVWRFAFAFDPERRAMVLCGGDKSGGNERRFLSATYKEGDSGLICIWRNLKRRRQQRSNKRKNDE